jgi:hypothetical protein
MGVGVGWCEEWVGKLFLHPTDLALYFRTYTLVLQTVFCSAFPPR